MNYTPYSHSKIACHEDCAQKFKIKYLDKVKYKPDQRHFEKGNYYHWILENYPTPPSEPFDWKYNPPAKREEFEQFIRGFLKHPRTQHLLKKFKSIREYNFQIHGELNNLQAIDANKYESTCYGYIDYMGYDIEDPTHIVVVDWKSQSQPYLKLPSDQMDMYATWVFMYMPNVNTVTVEYGFIQNGDYSSMTYKRDESAVDLKNKFINRITTVENDETFERNVTKKCKWCEYENVCQPFAQRR